MQCTQWRAVEMVFLLITGKTNFQAIKNSEAAAGRCNLIRKRKRKHSLCDQETYLYVLSSEEIKLAEKRSNAIVMPNSDFNPGVLFSKHTLMKSHDWKEVQLAYKRPHVYQHICIYRLYLRTSWNSAFGECYKKSKGKPCSALWHHCRNC